MVGRINPEVDSAEVEILRDSKVETAASLVLLFWRFPEERKVEGDDLETVMERMFFSNKGVAVEELLGWSILLGEIINLIVPIRCWTEVLYAAFNSVLTT